MLVHTHESTVILCTVCTTAVCAVSDESDYFECIVQEKIKDITVSGSEGVQMEEHEPGSGGGDDPSSLELTTADGECVLLYTAVNTTNCTHYCDSDTCL